MINIDFFVKIMCFKAHYLDKCPKGLTCMALANAYRNPKKTVVLRSLTNNSSLLQHSGSVSNTEVLIVTMMFSNSSS